MSEQYNSFFLNLYNSKTLHQTERLIPSFSRLNNIENFSNLEHFSNKKRKKKRKKKKRKKKKTQKKKITPKKKTPKKKKRIYLNHQLVLKKFIYVK